MRRILRNFFFFSSHTIKCHAVDENKSEGQQQITSSYESEVWIHESWSSEPFSFISSRLKISSQLCDVIQTLFPKSRVSILSLSVIWFYFELFRWLCWCLWSRKKKMMRNKQASIGNIQTARRQWSGNLSQVQWSNIFHCTIFRTKLSRSGNTCSSINQRQTATNDGKEVKTFLSLEIDKWRTFFNVFHEKIFHRHANLKIFVDTFNAKSAGNEIWVDTNFHNHFAFDESHETCSRCASYLLLNFSMI